MRAKEFLLEDYNQELETDLNNLLIAAKGSGSSKISTKDLITQLQNMGYSSVNPTSIMTVLGNNHSVINSTPEIITLSDAPPVTDSDSTDDSADKVKALARKAAKRQRKKES